MVSDRPSYLGEGNQLGDPGVVEPILAHYQSSDSGPLRQSWQQPPVGLKQ